MSLSLTSSVSAIAPLRQTYLLGVGGTAPYTYSVLPNGAGGSINASTGLYTAPASASIDPKKQFDVIQVIDAASNIATSRMLVSDALGLVCDIIQKELDLADGRVYLYNQKIFEPKDAGVFVVVQVLKCKPFANTNIVDGTGAGLDSIQSINMQALISIDIISRDLSALVRKEEVLMALNSNYSESQQELNSFSIGQLPPGAQFVNLSNIDGAAIPYRFNISVSLQYFVRKIKAVPYFDQFENVEVTTES